MEKIIPKYMFFTKGVGYHRNKLQSFELALRDAGVEFCNLVMISSIYPPGCKIISKQEGVKNLAPGQITFVVMARQETNEPARKQLYIAGKDRQFVSRSVAKSAHGHKDGLWTTVVALAVMLLV
jgi:pyruvoyl-dependent arginine decarboxylase (PvlArgDC)